MDRYYHVSELPGNKEGISASCIGGYNLVINNSTKEENKIAAGKVIDFLLSKDIQKKYIEKSMKHTALIDIYNDEDLCKDIDCSLYRNLQHVSRPITLTDNYDQYSSKFREYLNKFIYGNESAKNTLKNIHYIASINQIDYNSTLGIIIVSFTVAVIFIIAISYSLIFIKKFSFYQESFSKPIWFIKLLGICIILSSGLLYLGEKKIFKCNLNKALFLIGISLIFNPVLVKEIIHFPQNNKLSNFVKDHNYIAIFLLSLTNIVYILVIFIFSPYKITKVDVKDGMSFNICTIKNKLYLISTIILIIDKAIIIIAISLLSFIEWNINAIERDIRNFTIQIYTSIIFTTLFTIIMFVNIKNMFFYTLIRIFLFLFYGIIFYVITIWLRMTQELNHKKNQSNIKIVKNSKLADSISNLEKKSILSKIINFHYISGVSGTSINASAKDSIQENSPDAEVVLYTSLITTSQI